MNFDSLAGFLAALALAPCASADMLLRISDSVTVWNVGIAWTDGTNWYWQGWDRFPGVSPPWNPIAQPEVVTRAAIDARPVVVVSPPPPPPPPKTYRFTVAGETVTVQAAQ